MKRAKTLGLILFSFIISAHTFMSFKNDLSKQNLKGSVKYIFETKFTPNIKFGEVVSWEKQFTYDHLFNRFGNLDEENDYGSLGDLAYKTKYKYNVSGELSEKNMYQSDGSILYRFIYKYKDDENSILLDTYIHNELSGKYIQKYDENGNIVMIKAFNLEGKLEMTTNYSYNEKGLRTQENGLNHLLYKYDDYNNIISQTNSEKGSYPITYTYEVFDKEDNWLIKTQFNDGMPFEMIKREIEYY